MDCLFLITDAARRAGFDLDELISAGFDKLEVLKDRRYNRTPEGEPSYHEK